MLHYRTYEISPETPWVVFVHGAGGSSSIWFLQLKEFKKHFNVLMVDLRPTNSKLHSRAVRIVRLATGLEDPEAQAVLTACDGEVKVAIVTQLADCCPDEARRRLSESGGHVGQAIGRR